jgi:hypothetical protein
MAFSKKKVEIQKRRRDTYMLLLLLLHGLSTTMKCMVRFVLALIQLHHESKHALQLFKGLFTSPVFLSPKDVGICGDLVFMQYSPIP